MMRAPLWLHGLYGARAAYGGLLLLAPRGVLSAVARSSLDTGTVVVARLLGARQVAQSALLYGRPERDAQLLGATVDAAHSASMLALSRLSGAPAHRRLARRDARAAGMLALTGMAAAAGCHATRRAE